MPDQVGSAVSTLQANVLILEDVETDAELVEWLLRKSGLDVTTKVVATKAAFVAALDEFLPDIVLTDFKLPDFDGRQAIKLAHDRYPELPIIVVTGVLGDEAAVELIKAGAVDYVLKDRLARLPAAIMKALFEAEKTARLRKETAAVRAEKAISHAERDRFYAVAESASDAIIMMNARGIITFWNRSAEKLFGYSEIEAMGSDLHSLVARDRDQVWAIKGVSEFGRTGQGPYVGKTRELTARKRDGAEIQVEMSVSAIRLKGEWVAVGIVRDLTERANMIRL